MLVVVLVPLVVMVAACLLERLEAAAVPGEPTRRTPRATRATSPSVTAGEGAREPAERPRHLALVTGEAEDEAEDAAGDPLDPATVRLTLPRAS